MKITFRGVRGSIPSPGPKTVRYGGNSTCIEIRTDDNELIILDAGTGIFPLAQEILTEMPLTCHLFISHTHWDHIQGLPFFTPIFVSGNHILVHGPADPVSQKGIGEVLALQLQYAYFPIREAELNARMEYISLQELQAVEVGAAKVTPIIMNHPVINFGYKVECAGKSIFFTGDHEWHTNIYNPEDEEYGRYQEHIDAKRRLIIDFIRGADLFIADSAYTEHEYLAKKGWGHSTYDMTIQAARDAEVKQVIFTHHEPSRSDDDLEMIFADTLRDSAAANDNIGYRLAKEGLEIQL